MDNAAGNHLEFSIRFDSSFLFDSIIEIYYNNIIRRKQAGCQANY